MARAVDPLTAPAEAGLVSPDGTKALVVVDLTKDLEGAPFDEAVDATTDRLRRLGDDLPGEVLLGGNELLQRESAEQSQRDTERGELVALPITLAVMVVLFGGFVAAGIPLLGALCSIAGGLAALLGISYLMDLDPSVPSVTTVMGLGLSIDYALLIVQRYREERGLGRGPEDAVAVALSTAGRTISFSALTVATALTGLFVFELSIFRALGAAGVTVVVVALLVGLTLVPALIGAFHRRIRVPTTRVSDDGFFSRLARRTQRHALLVTLAVSGAAAGPRHAVPAGGVPERRRRPAPRGLRGAAVRRSGRRGLPHRGHRPGPGARPGACSRAADLGRHGRRPAGGGAGRPGRGPAGGLVDGRDRPRRARPRATRRRTWWTSYGPTGPTSRPG